MPGSRQTADGGTLDERALIEAAQRDRARFAAIYDLYVDRIHAFIARRVMNRTDAEDLTAEVFHQALTSLNKFEWRGVPFSAWLYRIASNAIADHRSRLFRESGLTASDAPSVQPNQADHDYSELNGFVRRLPSGQRRVLELRFGDEKTVGQIAAEIGRTEGAVRQIQFRALETLRARMANSARSRERKRSNG